MRMDSLRCLRASLLLYLKVRSGSTLKLKEIIVLSFGSESISYCSSSHVAPRLRKDQRYCQVSIYCTYRIVISVRVAAVSRASHHHSHALAFISAT
jgi:hypothetical protein